MMKAVAALIATVGVVNAAEPQTRTRTKMVDIFAPEFQDYLAKLYVARDKVWSTPLTEFKGAAAIRVAYAHRERGTFPKDLDFDTFVNAQKRVAAAASTGKESRRLDDTCEEAPFDELDPLAYVAYRPCIRSYSIDSEKFYAWNHPCFYPACDGYNILYPYCLYSPENIWQTNNWLTCFPPSGYDYDYDGETGCPLVFDLQDPMSWPGFMPPGDIPCVQQWGYDNPYDYLLDE